jgi:hypothetical protein
MKCADWGKSDPTANDRHSILENPKIEVGEMRQKKKGIISCTFGKPGDSHGLLDGQGKLFEGNVERQTWRRYAEISREHEKQANVLGVSYL